MQPLKLLLVEDYEPDYRWTCRVLQEVELPHTLFITRDGEAAWRFLHKEAEFSSVPTPDLAVLDLNLPKLNGDELFYMMISDPRLKDIATCVMSGSQLEMQELRRRGLHPTCFLTKPLTYRKLYAALESFNSLQHYAPSLKAPSIDSLFF